MSDIVSRAQEFATASHGAIDHRRKYTDDLYIIHPAAVARIVATVPHTDAMLAAAWLHDTVEDTNATLGDIQIMFGTEIADLVEMLTDVSKPSDGNRAVRKAKDLEHTAKSSPAAKTVKLADLIDNTRSIVMHDKNFAKVYLKEKLKLLKVLKDGDSRLWGLAVEMTTNNLMEMGESWE